MGRATTRIPMSHRVLSPNHDYATADTGNDQPPVQLSGSIFGFLEQETTVLSSPENDAFDVQQDIKNDNECEKPDDLDDKVIFWETQSQKLHATLFRTTSLESKIRNITKEAIGEMEMGEDVCSCSRPVSGGCRSCRMRGICSRLQNSGFNSAICKSKWKSSLDIPSDIFTFCECESFRQIVRFKMVEIVAREGQTKVVAPDGTVRVIENGTPEKVAQLQLLEDIRTEKYKARSVPRVEEFPTFTETEVEKIEEVQESPTSNKADVELYSSDFQKSLAGEHTFLDVIDNSNHKKGEVRVMIELELRGQFEMKKGSDEYNTLVRKLPDVFVGNFDRLQTVIKILSNGVKKCMKEKNMHLGPWRKQNYMLAKWLRVTERNTAATIVSPRLEVDVYSTPATRVRAASMLTIDLLGDLPKVSYFYAHGVEVL